VSAVARIDRQVRRSIAFLERTWKTPRPELQIEDPMVRAQATQQRIARLAAHVEAEGPRVLARLRRSMPEEDAEDLLQDACLRALERLGQLSADSALRPWFHAVLRSTISSYNRDRMRASGPRLAGTEWLDALPRASRSDTCACGARVLDRARPDHRRLLLRDHADRRIATIPRDQGITPGHARVRLHRARRDLRVAWTRFCGPCITIDRGAHCECESPRDGEQS